ncbi:MAG: outer membrane protein assembly factor BamC [Pseudomonadota bacterium]|jgi:outer membrane protein assembly factor BamC|uniref:outer membrane protein assembly factor BamC n=1 Tax=Burkholderia sp. PAMC 28687 TaxID=1795874 RepID=UPI000783BF6E|nr:outer membrane protein assembly factor BamC [Burkholderia sp. PAMC 28687]AMM14194.1 NlpB/DapX lipoprotein domain protein [Burkholderia sp. PAMC 28687]MDP9157405.1 outer membrane protein assembly factor BamC [Pseudomonadota bacterium]
MTDFRVNKPALKVAALLLAGGLVAGCGTSSPNAINYKSDSRSKQASLAVPPNLLEESGDQRSLPPQGGQASLSDLQQTQKVAPSAPTVIPPVSGMHIQRDGTERWLVIDNKSPEQAWPQIRRFWQEQGFLLVVDARDKGVMETDWNETHPQISDGLIRNTLSMATGNSYVAAERNKYRTRLEAGPNGGTYVFVSQKGMREALTGTNNDNSQWQAKPNDPALEGEYLKRLMSSLALADARQASGQTGMSDAAMAAAAASGPSAATASSRAAQNVALAAQTPIKEDVIPEATSDEITLPEAYDRAWLRVGLALDRTNFTVDDRDRGRGIYFVRYVDPKDMTAAEQGFWNQVFHGKKEKLPKNYEVNVRALTETQTRVSIIDSKGNVDSSPQARQIMALLDDQLR